MTNKTQYTQYIDVLDTIKPEFLIEALKRASAGWAFDYGKCMAAAQSGLPSETVKILKESADYWLLKKSETDTLISNIEACQKKKPEDRGR